MKHHAGFTLVELMVTLVILVLVLMTAVPLTQSWVNSASVMENKTLLQQAYGRTRGLALANPAGISNGSASAYLCVANSKIYVHPIRSGRATSRPAPASPWAPLARPISPAWG